MHLPPGFEETLRKEKVCNLNKLLYGLKQSPRAWFEKFTKSVCKLGYVRSQSDRTMFYRYSWGGKVTILIVYVHDVILTGHDIGEMENLKNLHAKEFQIKDLGDLRYFLGIEVARSKKGIFLSK